MHSVAMAMVVHMKYHGHSLYYQATVLAIDHFVLTERMCGRIINRAFRFRGMHFWVEMYGRQGGL